MRPTVVVSTRDRNILAIESEVRGALGNGVDSFLVVVGDTLPQVDHLAEQLLQGRLVGDLLADHLALGVDQVEVRNADLTRADESPQDLVARVRADPVARQSRVPSVAGLACDLSKY